MLNSNEVENLLYERLLNPKLIEGLAKLLVDARAGEGRPHPLDIIDQGTEKLKTEPVKQLFTRYVLRALPQPIILLKDLIDAASQHLVAYPDEPSFVKAYKERFAWRVINEVVEGDTWRSEEIKTCARVWVLNQSDEETVLWSSPCGLMAVASNKFAPEFEFSLYLYGYATVAALSEVKTRIEQIIPSIMKTVGMIGHLQSSGPRGTSNDEAEENRIDEILAMISDDLFDKLRLLEKRKVLLTDETIESADGKRLIAGCLTNSGVLSNTKPDAMQRRIGNALVLLREADAQGHPAIRLALCFAAIEALVCEKKDGIAEELSKRVATLLLPAALDRIDAIMLVKKLYNVRSEALHGTALDADFEAAVQSRALASAVLASVIHWCDNRTMGGHAPSRVDLFRNLEADLIRALPTVDAPENLGGCLSDDFFHRNT